jgi:hypothetical protein
MVVQILATDTVAVCVCIVSPAENARVWDIGRQEVAKPMHIVRRRPGLVVVAVQSVDSNDAGEGQYKLTGVGA